MGPPWIGEVPSSERSLLGSAGRTRGECGVGWAWILPPLAFVLVEVRLDLPTSQACQTKTAVKAVYESPHLQRRSGYGSASWRSVGSTDRLLVGMGTIVLD